MALSTLATNAVVGAANQIIDRVFESDAEKTKARAVLLEMQQRGQLAQLEINKAEAQHRSVFVAGWRPAVGWVGVFALALATVVFPLAQYCILVTTGEYIDTPDLDWSTLGPVLFGILGIGGFRTFEKTKGVTR